jgi:hypothetical protein
MSFWNQTIKLITGVEPASKAAKPRFRKLTTRDLIRMESKIGSQLFGPIPAGHRREFFCLDEQTWVWYEEWIDEATGRRQELTTRYELHPNGILKVQDGQPYMVVEGEELRNLAIAIRMYYQQTMQDIYHRDPMTGQKLGAAAGTI